MSEATTHSGSCHCGAVRYEVTTNLTPVISCNCSICIRTGSILTFVPKSQFKLLSGEENLSDYQFNTRKVHHLFCKTCGIRSFGTGTAPDGSEMIAINVRCLEGVDVSKLEVTQVDGKNF